MGFKMKPVNRNLADEFHQHSVDGIDAVFERMYKVAGNKLGLSFAEAFDVSENTVKTWRRREAVSTKFLQGFAQLHGTTIDYLLYGKEGKGSDGLVLTNAEREVIELFRAAPGALRDAALRVLQGAASPPPTTRIRVKGDMTGQVAGGNQINRGAVTISSGRRKK